VNFYLNGRYLAARPFTVEADKASAPYGGGGGYGGGGYGGGSYGGGGYGGGAYSGGGGGGAIDVPSVASGSIQGIGGNRSAGLELHLRPQPNGYLDGTLIVNLMGYGTTPLKGFVRGDKLVFTVPYGAETYDFTGTLTGDSISGTYDSGSGEHGNWSARAD
jgi:hypothetical protein